MIKSRSNTSGIEIPEGKNRRQREKQERNLRDFGVMPVNI